MGRKRETIIDVTDMTLEQIKGSPSSVMEFISAGDKGWDDVSEYMETEGSERLLHELMTMKGAAFVKNYLKLLEFFRPKLIRSNNNPLDNLDTNMTITIMQKSSDGEVKSLEITKKEIEDD